MADNKVNMVVEKIRTCGKSPYYIAKKTGLSNSSIANWLNGKTSPTPANIAILEHFLETEGGMNTNNINAGVISNSTVTQDNRSYYSDSPDVLRARIDELDRLIAEKEARIKEKDSQIKEKDSQIKEKDSQIKTLLDILAKK